MDILRNNLHIIFHKMPIQEVKYNLFNEFSLSHEFNNNLLDKRLYTRMGNCIFDNYTGNEINNIYQGLKNNMIVDKNNNDDIFNLLHKFTINVLIEMNHEPICKYEELLRWKMTSHDLGQDILTTSFLAYKDAMTSVKRIFFSWKPVINSNNIRLKNMLSKGIAENHFHLKGSSNTYELSWINLMNAPINREGDFQRSGMLHKRLDNELNGIYNDNIYSLVKEAAYIRFMLFTKVNNLPNNSFPWGTSIDERLNEDYYHKQILFEDSLDIRMDEIVNSLNQIQVEYGYAFHIYNNSDDVIIDYAIPKNANKMNINSNFVLMGERKLMYDIFKKIYESDRDILKYKGLFYLYLLIKVRFRAEMIQVNKKVGFQNFYEYQERKTYFIKNNDIYNYLLYRMAIKSTIDNQGIKKMEVRITPKNDEEKIIQQIKEIDNMITLPNLLNNQAEIISFGDKCLLDKYFYTLHFVKSINENSCCELAEEIISRNYDLRCRIKNKAIAISNLRENNSIITNRILGIDGCNNEIGVRPEVFAQAFRYLKNHVSTHKNDYIKEVSVPQIRATYHVGEEFLDILDGLRAIDETLLFLNLQQGDRIGHALALGIDVKTYYEYKNYTIILPKQDLLDNIVWFITKIQQYDLNIKHSLIEKLKAEYDMLFNEIYITNMMDEDCKGVYTYNDYYNSWTLRGDNPERYFEYKQDELKKHNDACMTFWGENDFNESTKASLRREEKYRLLYHYYHFGYEVKLTGREIIEYNISCDFVQAVVLLQDSLQKTISQKGIGIECNPSSNLLIGTIDKYCKHPLPKFFNLGLSNNSEELDRCRQLFVSINTDDQGVFSTDLENEYALMAIALEKEKDELGNPKYNKVQIYNWLDKIREMGIEQSFTMD